MFDLEPHETASDADASWFKSQSEAPNRGELWRVAIENRGQSGVGRVLMKRANHPVLVAASAEKEPFRAVALGEKSLDFSVEPFGLRTSLDNCLANEKWVRSLFLNAQFTPRKPGETAAFQIVLSPHGWGLWRAFEWPSEPPYGSWYQAEWVFPLIPARELAVLRAEQIVARLFAHSAETADFRFAREFLKLSPAQQEAHLWSWGRGDLAQLQNVLRMAFLAQEELWREPNTLMWEVDLSNGDLGPHRLRDENRLPLSVPQALRQAQQRAVAWFGFEIHRQMHERHLCLKHLYHAKVRELSISIEAREPTAHERLEAMLDWRAWLDTI